MRYNLKLEHIDPFLSTQKLIKKSEAHCGIYNFSMQMAVDSHLITPSG